MLHLIAVFIVWVSTVLGQGKEYTLLTGPLDTNWTSKVGTNPWPEYPRPQMERSDWKNLNGVWQYQNTTEGAFDNPPFGQELENPVLVPFCLESALSGVMGSRTIWNWYRTTFDVPESWNDRVVLNFGAVDWETTVFVNEHNVTRHTGGYFSFNVDITDFLNKNGTNELVVTVFDPTNLAPYNIPVGKQRLNPEHIFYTPCSGIWQTVWLESVPSKSIEKFDINAFADGEVLVFVQTKSFNVTDAKITFYEPGTEDVKFEDTVPVNQHYSFHVENPMLWSPEDPKLYNVTVQLENDTVKSYTGFRTVSRGIVNGVHRPLLNGKPFFMFGTLDQGYWPDGLHTPPSLEAMVFDIKFLKDMGYNMLRKHIKVEPALFYQAADQLGMLLIQDMPALTTKWNYDNSPPGYKDKYPDPRLDQDPYQNEYDRELGLMVDQLKNYPSIVTWVIYNEAWGQNGNNRSVDAVLTDYVRKRDPFRLIDAVTGWNDHGAGDFHDPHHYPGAWCGVPWGNKGEQTTYDGKRIAINGEFGGLGTNVTEDHAWKVKQSIDKVWDTYEVQNNLDEYNLRAAYLFREVHYQVETYPCSGFVWTQTTDVEGEINGMLTYDRREHRPNITQWQEDIKKTFDIAAARMDGPVEEVGGH